MGLLAFLRRRADDMLTLGLEHVAVVLVALLCASVVGVGVGVATYRSDRARSVALAVSGTFLTIPSFALLVLLVGPLGLGARNVVVALTLYGLLPVLRNTVVGLREVPVAVVESATGMGMSRRQRLLRVELPLAWPVILTGMRVSALILVGGAAIGAVVLGPGYGELIFAGLARVGTDVALHLVLAGVLGVLVVAVLFDVAFTLLRRVTTSRGLR